MKKTFSYLLFAAIIFAFQSCSGQKPINWSTDELIEPAALAQTIESNKDLPLIYCIGPGVVIPHSIDIGMVRDSENLAKLKTSISKLSRDTSIVIYCGCCPFDHCPNVRPAVALLKEMKFTNFKLLNLPDNIKADWIAKGYPQVK